MHLKTKVLLVLIIVLLATPAFGDYDYLIQQIDKVWQARNGDTRPMKDALKWAEQAYGEKPGFEAAYRAARACFWICDRTEDQKIDLEYGKRGVEWAEKAIKANPGAVEGHYFYTACLGEYGKGMSIVTALAKGLGSKYEKSCNKAISINAGYDHGGPYRALARYYYKLPWPKYDAEKSENYYKKALEAGPKQARTYAWLADLYIKEKKFDKAKEVLKKLDALQSGYADATYDHKYYKRYGKDLEEQIKGK